MDQNIRDLKIKLGIKDLVNSFIQMELFMRATSIKESSMVRVLLSTQMVVDTLLSGIGERCWKVNISFMISSNLILINGNIAQSRIGDFILRTPRV